MEYFETPYGRFSLDRLPLQTNDTLRAWDAADELLLSHLADTVEALDDKRILCINDQFAALSIALHTQQVWHWSDSFIAHQSAAHNLELNEIYRHQIQCLKSTELPEPGTQFDIVLIKVPKTLALLEEQLIQLRPFIRKDSLIIGAGMVKHIHTSTLKLFEKYLGTTRTSLARKKARLIFSQAEQAGQSADSPYPSQYQDDLTGLSLNNHANVFSREKLDIGARFMLEQFAKLPAANSIIDLGCGNGVLGIMAQRQLPQSQLHFVDESYMAVACAELNFTQACPEHSARYYASDALDELRDLRTDLILCNPPFHQQHAVGDYIAWKMFKQSHKALNKGGQLWIVGNRHLGYHIKLKKLFGNCQTIAANKKFVVLAATK